MSTKRNQGMRGCIIGLLAIACLLSSIIGWASNEMPRWATRNFGSASSEHNWPMRVYLSSQLYIHRYDLTQPLDVFGSEQDFEVSLGESPNQVAHRLEQDGLIRNSEAFRVYLVYSGLDTTLQAGLFRISPAWSAVEIARKLQDATPGEVSFRLIAGWRLEEVAAALPVNGVQINPQDFIQAARTPGLVQLAIDWPAERSLEGYLFPGVYRIKREAGVEEILNLFVSRFFEQVTPEMREGFARQNLDLAQAVTLASIIQREAVIEDEMPMIASVFLNRIAIGMKLDSDPTVQYAMGFQENRGGWWPNPLYLNDLQVDSPYNTYMYTGLPPTPISNPSLAALHAVAQPAQTPYYYFRAACDGSGRHNFAQTFEEQVQNACP